MILTLTVDPETQVLLRKGGIREPTFRPAARRFLLLPTSFHSAADSLKLGVAATYAKAWHHPIYCLHRTQPINKPKPSS